MATTYRMEFDDYSLEDLGYVEITMSPEPGDPIFPGETVTINGKILSKRIAVKRLFFNFPNTDPDVDFDAEPEFVLLKSFAKNATGSFSVSFKLNERMFSGMAGRFETFEEFYISISDQEQDSDTATGLTTRFGPNLVYGKYRLAPQILAMDFERATPEGKWADDGQYLQCKVLKLSIDPQAEVGDITKATITCTGSDGSSRSVDLTQDQLSAALTPDGYSETEPGIFADFASALGVDYTLTLTLGDDYDQATFADIVMRSFARLHFSGAKNGGVAVGMFSSSTDDTPKFEVADTHKTYLFGGVESFGDGEKCLLSQQALGIQYGSLSFTVAANTTLNQTVVFPKPFVSPPLVIGGMTSGGPTQNYGYIGVVLNRDTITATQCTIVICNRHTNQHIMGCNWVAIGQMGPASSSDPALPGPEIFDDPDEDFDGPYADPGIARADYIAMMAGIEIPVDAEVTGGVQADAGGMESPGIEGEPAHSAKYDTVKLYCDAEVWNAQMVRNAVGKWITAEEAEEILNVDSTKGA